MTRRVKERVLIEEESDDVTKVYRTRWVEIPDKPAPKPPDEDAECVVSSR